MDTKYIANALGRRKCAVARVYVKEGNGKITINKRDLTEYFPSTILQYVVKQPLALLDVMEKYDIMRTKFGAYDEIATFTYYIFSSDPDEALEIAEAFRRVILGVRIDGRGLDITGAENTLTEYEIKGKAWYAYIFPLRVSNLDYRR